MKYVRVKNPSEQYSKCKTHNSMHEQVSTELHIKVPIARHFHFQQYKLYKEIKIIEKLLMHQTKQQ